MTAFLHDGDLPADLRLGGQVTVMEEGGHDLAPAACGRASTIEAGRPPTKGRWPPPPRRMVPRKGLEPSRPLSHWHLKPARLPIPPPGPGGRHRGPPPALSILRFRGVLEGPQGPIQP